MRRDRRIVLVEVPFDLVLIQSVDIDLFDWFMRKRGDLLALADDMLIMSNEKSEID